jgi:hypothetical protein
MRDHRIAIDRARRSDRPPFGEGFDLALQLCACAFGALRPFLVQDNPLKTVMAALAHIFKDWHGSFHLEEIITAED